MNGQPEHGPFFHCTTQEPLWRFHRNLRSDKWRCPSAFVLAVLLHLCMGILLAGFAQNRNAQQRLPDPIQVRLMTATPGIRALEEKAIPPVAVQRTGRRSRFMNVPGQVSEESIATSSLVAGEAGAPEKMVAFPEATEPALTAPEISPSSASAKVAADSGVAEGYKKQIAESLARHQHYPRMARVRNWKGTAILQLDFGSDGRLDSYRLVRSSGHSILDDQAVQILVASLPLPRLPAPLEGNRLSLEVPVEFRLTD
jgi:TonB family protein